MIPNGFDREVKKFYYDIASVAVNPTAMLALFNVIPKDHLIVRVGYVRFWTIEKIATAMNKFDISRRPSQDSARERAPVSAAIQILRGR